MDLQGGWGTGIQAKAKRIGYGLEVLLPKTVAMVWFEIWLFLNSFLHSEFLPLLLEVMLMLRMQGGKGSYYCGCAEHFVCCCCCSKESCCCSGYDEAAAAVI
ncbi:hypothetical protein Acr_00g0072180 [Actinidia rufa]|uniref:Uncharacterized protein n=1 Tax=Actinidia rufa TaxID=165716 RepID=A0A7J0DS81_9ERIC|nr:hypothetical protein Acr_00g0072180 [Actinidia rufa]